MEITGVVVVPAEANRQWLHWNFVGGVPEKLGRLLKAFMSVSGSRYDKHYQTPRVWLTGYDELITLRRATTLFGLHVAPPLAVRGLYVKPGTMLALLASLGKKLLVSVIMFHFCLYLSQRKKKKVSAQTHIYHHVQRHGMHDVAFGISSSEYTDAWVPITASRYSINTFNLPIETAWRPCEKNLKLLLVGVVQDVTQCPHDP
ncbi:hypothetical protein Tco_1009415 [Tanacetum coccineum]